MTEVTTINLFYPFLFFIIVVITIVIGLVIKGKFDTDIFFKSSDNAKDVTIDTTDKFSKSHTEIVAGIPIEYQKELHALEAETEKNTELIKEILDKMDLLIERVAKLEREN